MPDAPTSVSAAPAAPSAISQQLICAALQLGWCTADLYAAVRPESLTPPPRPAGPIPTIVTPPTNRPQLQADLPGVGTFTKASQHRLLVAKVDAGVHQVASVVAAAGLSLPPRPDFAALMLASGAEGRYELAAALLTYHIDLLSTLAASDASIGNAYGLGRALADLVLRPQGQDQTSFTGDLRTGRVRVLQNNLGVLTSMLPAHAAQAVATSMQRWQQWAEQPTWGGTTLDWQAHGAEVTHAFTAQGERWRVLLAGEKSPLDELTADDYVDAGGYLLGRIRVYLQRFALQFWPALLVLGTLTALGIVVALLFLGSPEVRVAGAIASVLAGLGITAASVGSALGRMATSAEDSLWQAELDLAVARAISLLPADAATAQMGEPRAPFPRVTRTLAARQAVRHSS